MKKWLVILIAWTLSAYLIKAQPIKWSIDSLLHKEISVEDSLLIDSCERIFQSAKTDTAKIIGLNGIVQLSWDDNVWVPYNHFILDRSLELLANENNNECIKFYKNIIAGAYNNIGYNSSDKGDIPKAIEYYKRSIKLSEETNDEYTTSMGYNNLGLVYFHQGLQGDALDCFLKAQVLLEKLNDKEGLSYVLGNIGLIYKKQEDIDEAIKYYEQSLTIRKELNDQIGIANSYGNIGQIYVFEKKYDEALKYLFQALTIQKDRNDEVSLSDTYNNIGFVYEETSNYDSAIYYYQMSFDIKFEQDEKHGTVFALTNIARLDRFKGELNLARKKATDAYNLAKSVGYMAEMETSSLELCQIYKELHDYEKALEYYEVSIQYGDSVRNTENQKEIIRKQTAYEFEKEQLIKEQNEKEEFRIQNEAVERRNNLQYSIILVAILFVFGGVLALGKINISPKFAEGLIFFAFLVFFEFLLVLSDPYIENMTSGAPAYKLLANAILAAAIFPLHAFFERYLKFRLIKNKRK